MGCDIHMYVEKKDHQTGRWVKVGNDFLDNWLLEPIVDLLHNWYKVEKKDAIEIIRNYYNDLPPRNKAERHIYKTLDIKVTNDPNHKWWEDTSKFMSPKTDQPYTGRNYTLFGTLAGVRDRSLEMISDIRRGLPDDVSDEVCELSDRWGFDAHSHNYLTLEELINNMYYKMSDEELDEYELGTSFFRNTINELKRIGEPKDVRIVFWFDN